MGSLPIMSTMEHLDIPVKLSFKQRLIAIYKLIFIKNITVRFEWEDEASKIKSALKEYEKITQ